MCYDKEYKCSAVFQMGKQMMGKYGKNRIIHKSILPVLLAAALLLEPLNGMPVVNAEEMQEEIQYGYGEDRTDSVSDNDDSESGEDGDRDGEAEDDAGDRTGEEEGGFGDGDEAEENRAEDGESVEGREENDDTVKEDQDVTVSGNEIEEVSDSDGFSDMPADYRLTAFQRELKADMYSTLSSFREEDEGETFAADQVITFAESEEEAELIAEAYHAEIVCFDMGVLTMKLGGRNTVKTALLAAADMDNDLPPVWPNYIRELYGAFEPGTEDMSESETEHVSTSELEITEEEYAIDGVDEELPQENERYNDPYLKPAASQYQWFHTTIGSAYAWAAGYTGDGVKVGVIDSGVDANADLDANIDDKRDFCDGTNEVIDCHPSKHGTHVAGIIAAVAGNASGGAGVAPQAKIINARVFGETASKSGHDATIIAAINYLIGEENNATGKEPGSDPSRVDIINMSLGGPGMSSAFQTVLDKAYQKGIIVFAATGNDGGTLQMYPASYNHVIAVAATDNNNERAYFSNYGASTDLSAPGVGIYSTVGSGYGSKQGTSMACPVAAGEAAVILSGKAALPSMKDANGNDKTGAARVDAVESIMKGSTISAGSGMGRGITSLTKVFGLSTAATKPKTPVITVLPDDTKQSVAVTIRVQDGMTVCYTTNGKNPVYKNGAAGAGTTVSGDREIFFTIDCSNSAKGTIKAIAVNASGVVSPVKSVSYTLHPYVSAITVSGPVRVEQGKSIQLKAAVTPTYATNKSVTWEIQTVTVEGKTVDPAKIKIDQKGKITTAQDADIETYQVIVRAKDDGGKESKPYSVQVVAANTAIQKIAFGKNVKKELWLDAKTQENTISLFDYVTAEKKDDTGKKNLPITDDEEREELKKHLVWTSSKPAVAEVDLATGKVTAKTTGTTTITVKTDDNLAKKAAVNITVKQAVTRIKIWTDKEVADTYKTPIIAAGKSISLKAIIEPSKPANKKVNWSIAPDTAAGNTASADDMKNITINRTTGKITTKANAVPGFYVVTAEAADGKGAKRTRTVKVIKGGIGEIKLDQTKTTLYTMGEGGPADATITATITGVKDKKTGAVSEFDPEAYMVTISNESAVYIVTAIAETEDSVTKVKIRLHSTGEMFGKANITIVSTDGSNKKATCVVTVKGGIKKVRLQDTAGSKVSKLALFRNGTDAKSPKTAEIYAVIEGSVGANKEAYEVTSSNPSLVQAEINKITGKITLTAGDKITGKATITLKTTDGSNKKAACTVTVNNPPSRINIAPKAGTTKYVAPGKSVQLKATLETEYGAVAGKSVTWSLPESYKASGITVNKSGKVSVSKSYSNTGSVPVTATAKDGSGISATCYVTVVKPTTYITMAGRIESGGVTRITFYSDCSTTAMSCSSSSPGVISPTISYSPAAGSGTITFVPVKKGTATITIKALDSTGKTCREVYRVK